jgi:hypothetical protein
MLNRDRLSSAIVVCVALLAFSIGAQGQTCPGSHLTYIVRDDKGKPIDAAQKDLQFKIDSATGLSTSKWFASGKQFIKYLSNVPEDINRLNGTIHAIYTSAMCNFQQPVNLTVTWKDQTMNLTFLVPTLSRNDSKDFLVDSLPIKTGDYEIDLTKDPEGKRYFYPATGWKKVKFSRLLNGRG